MTKEPTSLQEAIVYFSNPDNCIDYLAVRRWPKGVTCPGCGAEKVSFNANRRTWKCGSHHPKREFSIKVGTIFEDSPISLDKWLTATWMLTNCKNGVSSYEIARDLKITQKSAWFMLHRIRLAMQDETFGGKLGGGSKQVEVDETFIGAKARNIHQNKRGQKLGKANKAMVVGVLERGGKIRTHVAEDRRAIALCGIVREHVEPKTALFTDKLMSYNELDTEFAHEVVDHAEGYVRGQVHTNGLENFWSLLKRGLHGTYVSVEPFHLFRYLDEQTFRYNNRKDLDDSGRFDRVVSQIVGKRITFAQLTAKPN
jgi:transposase-like protein